MARYLATQIRLGKLDYDTVIKRFPKYADAINEYLRQDGVLDKYIKREYDYASLEDE